MLADIWKRIRDVAPLVHCITNYVTANDCANLLLGVGASPIMADDPMEAEEITAMSHGVVLNLGTPNPRKLEAMIIAGQAANRLKKPVVLDPVGAGSSQMRQEAVQRLLKNVQFSVIRGNASEIQTLLAGTSARRGVDTDGDMENASEMAAQLARQYHSAVLLSGETDAVTDGRRVYRVHNGHSMMRCVTGAGCMLSALTGACIASAPDTPLEAALASACAMGVCGEIAHAHLAPEAGNASYRNGILDALYHLTAETLERNARYEME